MITIEELRDRIDKIDAEIIKKLSKRQKTSVKIGKLKSKQDKAVVDKDREQELFRRYERLCCENNLNPTLIKRVFKLIIANSRSLQE